jgi:anti-sigma-K factor RskA
MKRQEIQLAASKVVCWRDNTSAVANSVLSRESTIEKWVHLKKKIARVSHVFYIWKFLKQPLWATRSCGRVVINIVVVVVVVVIVVADLFSKKEEE